MRKIRLIMAVMIVLSIMILSCSHAYELDYKDTIGERMESQTVTINDGEQFSIGGYPACYLESSMGGIVWDFGYEENTIAHPYAVGVYDENTGKFTPLSMEAFFLSGTTTHSNITYEYDKNPASVYIPEAGSEQRICLISIDPAVSINDLRLQYKTNSMNESTMARHSGTDISSLSSTAPGRIIESTVDSGSTGEVSTEAPVSTWGEGSLVISGENVTIHDNNEDTIFISLYKMIAGLFRMMANGLNNLVQFSVNAVTDNKTIVTTDDLVFNHFSETSIDFYGTTKLSETSLANKFKNSIIKWYQRFYSFALVGYLIILLYIGIKILLSSGGESSAKYKELLLAWLYGVLILIFFKYAMRAIIIANNTLVSMVEKTKPPFSEMRPTIDLQVPTKYDQENGKLLADSLDQNIYKGVSSNNYMAQMANMAEDNPADITSALVYLIMVIQFITLLIYYYKRAFMVSFLIVIFPFIGLSYGIDRLGDGKSQAFDTWMKEFATNVFVQAVHAIIYVFVVSVTVVGGNYNGGWLLSIVGITFLFKGEQILKTIFGLGGSTARSLAETSKRTIATVASAKLIGSAVGKTVKATKTTINTYRRYRTEKKISENDSLFSRETDVTIDDNSRTRNISETSSIRAMPRPPSGPRSAEYQQVAQAVNTINSINESNPEDIAKALQTIQGSMSSLDGDVQNLIKTLPYSTSQLSALTVTQAKIGKMILRGKKDTREDMLKLKRTVDQEIDIELEHILPTASYYERAKMKVAMLHAVADTSEVMLDRTTRARGGRRLTDGEVHTYSKEFSPYLVTQEIEYKRRAIDNFFNPFKESKKMKRDEHGKLVSPFAVTHRAVPLSKHAQKDADRVLSSRFGVTRARASDKQKRFAESVAIMHELGARAGNDKTNNEPTRYSIQQFKDAADFLASSEVEDPKLKKAILAEFTHSGEDGQTTQLTGKDLQSIVNESIIRFHAKNPDGRIQQRYDGFDEDVSIEVIRMSSRISDREREFFDREGIAKQSKTPFVLDRENVPLSSNATIARNRMLMDYYGKTAGTASPKELEICSGLAMVKEYSASCKTQEERKTSEYGAEFSSQETVAYSAPQLQEAFAMLELEETNNQSIRDMISKEIPVSAKEAHRFFTDETKRRYFEASDADKSRFISLLGNEVAIPIDGTRTKEKPTNMERALAIKAATRAFDKAVDEKARAETHVSSDGVSIDAVTGITVDDIFRLDEQIERTLGTASYRDLTSGYANDVASARAKTVNAIAESMIDSTSIDAIVQGDSTATGNHELDKIISDTSHGTRGFQVDRPTFNGLTQDEHREYAKALKKRAIREAVEAGSRITGVSMGSIVGAGLGIGIGDDSSMLHEAIVGGAAGMTLSNKGADLAYDGLGTKTKRIKVISPYTGEPEEVDITISGINSNESLLALNFDRIRENEIVTLDDPRLRDFNKFDLEETLLKKHQTAEEKKRREKLEKFKKAVKK